MTVDQHDKIVVWEVVYNRKYTIRVRDDKHAKWTDTYGSLLPIQPRTRNPILLQSYAEQISV